MAVAFHGMTDVAVGRATAAHETTTAVIDKATAAVVVSEVTAENIFSKTCPVLGGKWNISVDMVY